MNTVDMIEALANKVADLEDRIAAREKRSKQQDRVNLEIHSRIGELGQRVEELWKDYESSMETITEGMNELQDRIAALEELYKPHFKVGDRAVLNESGTPYEGTIIRVRQPITYDHESDGGCITYGRDHEALKPEPAPEEPKPLAPLKERIEKLVRGWVRDEDSAGWDLHDAIEAELDKEDK